MCCGRTRRSSRCSSASSSALLCRACRSSRLLRASIAAMSCRPHPHPSLLPSAAEACMTCLGILRSTETSNVPQSQSWMIDHLLWLKAVPHVICCQAGHLVWEGDVALNHLAHVAQLEVEDGQGLRKVVHGARGFAGPLQHRGHHRTALQHRMHVGRLRRCTFSVSHMSAPCRWLGYGGWH